MGIGLPILSCISGQLHDLIEEHNVGRNYIAGNPKDLAHNIIWFHEHRKNLSEMGNNAYLLVKKYFTADNISNSYVDFLGEIVKDS